jgi:hypothetical protein
MAAQAHSALNCCFTEVPPFNDDQMGVRVGRTCISALHGYIV